MLNMVNEYYKCPYCHCPIKFKYSAINNIYRSKCPFCEEVLEIEKDEFERDKEIYFLSIMYLWR